jgi:protein-S-isoprenylcysteine O-methyltransferase Ste14
MAGCIVALAAAVVYAIVRLYVLSQRFDASIIVINVVVFAGIAGFMIYLTKKERDLEKKEFFGN